MREKTGTKKLKGHAYIVEAQSLPKTATKIDGLDQVLHGGLPTGRLTIINGGPGSGKTIFGLELIVRRAEADESAVFISFEETSEAIRRNAMALGWDLALLEKEGKLALINPEIDLNAVAAGEYEIKGMCAILTAQAKRINAKMIVIDAVDMLMRLFKDPDQVRNQLIFLNHWFNDQKLTTVLTVKADEDSGRGFSYLEFMADCVIRLDQRIHRQVNTRRLLVRKYRGSDYSSREHPFVISKRGIVVMLLTFVGMVQRETGKFVSSGNESMDTVLGGGYRKGSSILISGPSGSGKTTLAFMLSTAAALNGERVLYLSFEQTETALASEMKSVGFNLPALVKKGTLRISSIMPESMGMEEHLNCIIQEIEKYKPGLLVLDAISATDRICSAQAAKEFLILLYHTAKRRGITCIYTNHTLRSIEDRLEISGIGISSLVDTAIILNYFREDERLGRNLLVLKSRGTRHSDIYHEFRITDNGITIADSKNRWRLS